MSTRQTGIAKKLLLSAATLALCLVAIEIAVRTLGLWETERTIFTRTAKDPEQEVSIDTKSLPHPYLGWQARPGRRARFLDPDRLDVVFDEGEPSGWALANSRVNRMGFLSDIQDYGDLSAEDYVVGIFGGSVASGLASIGGEAMSAALERKFPHLAGKIRIANFSSSGYRQPQQTFVLALMLTMGVPIDLVINVDGYNEAVFGTRDAFSGYHPVFPGSDRLQSAANSANGASEEWLEAAGAVVREKRRSVRFSRRFGSSFLRHSELAVSVAGLLLARQQNRILELETHLAELSSADALESDLFLQSNPCEDEECRILVANIWEQASRLMAAMSQQIGASYIHALQPNQHLEGSKPLSTEEVSSFYAPNRPQAEAVRLTYPLLRERGGFLQGDGIRFLDLTGLFSSEQRTLYADSCCHYNRAGYELLARSLIEQVDDVRESAALRGQRPRILLEAL